MSNSFEFDIFLSHSSRDQSPVRELAQLLKADGFSVWLDEWMIKPGDSIPLAIERGLQASRLLILAMSEHSVGFEASSDWVALERHTALFRDPTNRERRFIPLRLDNVRVGDLLKQFAYIDWRERSHEQYSRLVEACRLGTQPISSQLKSPSRQLIRIAGVRKMAPLNTVLVDGHVWIDAAVCKKRGFGRSLTSQTHFVSSDCVLRFEVNTTLRRVVIDDVVVRVLSYQPPLKILDGRYVSPAMSANLYAVEIDSPQNSGTQIYYGGLISNSSLDYVVVTQDQPEIVYVITAALTPGIYKFSVGVIGRVGNDTQTEWVEDLEVYFEPTRAPVRAVPKDPIEILKSRNDPETTLWDVTDAIQNIGRYAPPGAGQELRIALLDSANPLHHQLVEPVCVSLAMLEGAASFETLTRVFSDPRNQFANIWAATAGLVLINTKQSIEFLQRALDEPTVRSKVLFQLTRENRLPDALVPVIVDLTKNSGDLGSRTDAIEALGRTSAPAAVAELISMIRDDELDAQSPLLRTLAVRALANSVDQLGPYIIGDIMALIRGGDDMLKEEAIRLLGRFRQKDAKVVLRQLLRDGNISTGVEAANSLALLDDNEAFPLIVDVANKAGHYEKDKLIRSAISLAATRHIPDLLRIWEQIPAWTSFRDYEKSDLVAVIVNKLTELTGERLGYFENSALITASSNARLLERWWVWVRRPERLG